MGQPIDRIEQKFHRSGLKLNPPVALDELDRFEQEAGIEIPSEYRDFLLRVGNGGVKHNCMLPLKHWSWGYTSEEVQPSGLAEPCVLSPEHEHSGRSWIDRLGVVGAEEKWDREEWDPMFGTMAIAEFGCGCLYHLVVNGPYRGLIFGWGDHPLMPPQFGKGVTFFEWFESRLDAMIETGISELWAWPGMKK